MSYSEREMTLATWFLMWTDDEDDDEETREAAAEERAKAKAEYLAQLEPVGISRCPFTRDVVAWAVDVAGLDGPFWDAKNPVRHPLPQAPATLLGVMGAVQLTGDQADIPSFPFLAMPGPEVPFVLPRILEHPDVVAVVSAVLVTPHAGFAIAYYAKPGASGVAKVPEWGTAEAAALAGEYDYDLARWIEAGKLRWIEPYSKSLDLQTGLKRCPYVDQPGHREITRIRDLDVWWPSTRADEE